MICNSRRGTYLTHRPIIHVFQRKWNSGHTVADVSDSSLTKIKFNVLECSTMLYTIQSITPPPAVGQLSSTAFFLLERRKRPAHLPTVISCPCPEAFFRERALATVGFRSNSSLVHTAGHWPNWGSSGFASCASKPVTPITSIAGVAPLPYSVFFWSGQKFVLFVLRMPRTNIFPKNHAKLLNGRCGRPKQPMLADKKWSGTENP